MPRTQLRSRLKFTYLVSFIFLRSIFLYLILSLALRSVQFVSNTLNRVTDHLKSKLNFFSHVDWRFALVWFKKKILNVFFFFWKIISFLKILCGLYFKRGIPCKNSLGRKCIRLFVIGTGLGVSQFWLTCDVFYWDFPQLSYRLVIFVHSRVHVLLAHVIFYDLSSLSDSDLSICVLWICTAWLHSTCV